MLRFNMTPLKVGLVLGCMSTIGVIDLLGLLSLNPAQQQPQAAFAAPKRRPYRRASGGKRGVCGPNRNQPTEDLMAFLPKNDRKKDLTATKAPQFSFYVPDQPKDVAGLEFRLEYASGPKRKQPALNPTMNVAFNQAGLVNVQLPEILEPDTDYKWSFTLRCVTSRETVAFSGLVRHQPLDAKIANQIAQAPSAAEKATIYSQQGLDLDAIAVLINNRSAQSQSFAAILAAVELESPGK
jgi:hypothetical protein